MYIKRYHCNRAYSYNNNNKNNNISKSVCVKCERVCTNPYSQICVLAHMIYCIYWKEGKGHGNLLFFMCVCVCTSRMDLCEFYEGIASTLQQHAFNPRAI